MKELIDWLKGEKYIIDKPSDSMTENFEKEHLWELSRNRMIDKTIKKIEEDILVSTRNSNTTARGIASNSRNNSTSISIGNHNKWFLNDNILKRTK